MVEFVMTLGADHGTVERVCNHRTMTVKPSERVLPTHYRPRSARSWLSNTSNFRRQ